MTKFFHVDLDNEAETVKWIRKAAELGDVTAQHKLSQLYYYGEGGVIQDEAESVKWLQKAAEQGDYLAILELSSCYFCGAGVPQNETEAINWLRRAVDFGHNAALRQISDCYFRGKGVPKDEQEAMNWLRKAVESGKDYALSELGMHHLYLRNDEEAVKCFLAAAEEGDDEAEYMLGECYAHGWGVTQNNEEAENWYNKASNSRKTTQMRATISCC